MNKKGTHTIFSLEKRVDELAELKLKHLLSQLKTKADAKRKALKDKKIEKILKHLSKNSTITNREIRHITDVSEMTAVYYLRELIKKEKIKKLNKGRNVAYKLS